MKQGVFCSRARSLVGRVSPREPAAWDTEPTNISATMIYPQLFFKMEAKQLSIMGTSHIIISTDSSI
jgi:hypothetical protein